MTIVEPTPRPRGVSDGRGATRALGGLELIRGTRAKVKSYARVLGSAGRFATWRYTGGGARRPCRSRVMTLDHLLFRTPDRVGRHQREQQNREDHEV
jgi:hypothetical protein